MTEPLSSLGKLRKESKELLEIEKYDNESENTDRPLWVNYGERSIAYDDFLDLIKEKDLKTHVILQAEKYKELGIPYCALDLFSPLSSWLNRVQKRNENGSLPLDGGVASTLDDPRNEKIKMLDTKKNLYCVAGDITTPGPRKELYNVMKSLKIDNIGFGVIIARPYGGARIGKNDEEYNAFYYSLLRQFWSLTSKHEGGIFCPVPDTLSKSRLLHKWVFLMKESIHATVELNKTENYMKIIKHQDSGEKLPGLAELGI